MIFAVHIHWVSVWNLKHGWGIADLICNNSCSLTDRFFLTDMFRNAAPAGKWHAGQSKKAEERLWELQLIH